MTAGKTPGQVARAFHEAYEELAPHFGYKTREASAKPWDDVPEQNRKLMTATVQRLIADGAICARTDLEEQLVAARKTVADYAYANGQHIARIHELEQAVRDLETRLLDGPAPGLAAVTTQRDDLKRGITALADEADEAYTRFRVYGDRSRALTHARDHVAALRKLVTP